MVNFLGLFIFLLYYLLVEAGLAQMSSLTNFFTRFDFTLKSFMNYNPPCSHNSKIKAGMNAKICFILNYLCRKDFGPKKQILKGS